MRDGGECGMLAETTGGYAKQIVHGFLVWDDLFPSKINFRKFIRVGLEA